MNIPASRLVPILESLINPHDEDWQGITFPLRRENHELADSALPWMEAMQLAMRGDIEAVTNASGAKLRYLRLIPENARERQPEPTEEELLAKKLEKSRSTAFAATNMGVVREPVREVVVTEEFGMRRAVASGDITGYMYSLRLNQPTSARHAQ